MKICVKCDKNKDDWDFTKNSKKCRQCVSAYDRNRYDTKPGYFTDLRQKKATKSHEV